MTTASGRTAAALLLGGALLGWPGTVAVAAPANPGTAAPARTLQERCPAAANDLAAEGWERYRSDELAESRSSFRKAIERCPGHAGAQNGLAYVHLRTGELGRAGELFQSVLRSHPDDVDARVGRGLVAFREGRLREAARHLERALDLDPDNPTASQVLNRIPEGSRPPPERPPLRRPETLQLHARTAGAGFQVKEDGRWEPFYVKGVNLGAAVPGRFPSQFPDEDRYRQWIGEIAAMGANVIRLYTIHPPGLYRSVARYNEAHPDAPLWIVHGVWTEPAPEADFADPRWEQSFFEEMHRVVDVIHGRASLEPRPGHASGHYTADVSRWTLAYIIGREWEPQDVERFDDTSTLGGDWDGRYLSVTGGSPTEVWLARACEEMISYEMDRYHEQRPIAYTSWPTLDPLHHPTETTNREQWDIMRSLGIAVGDRPPEYDFDEDAVGLDATVVSEQPSYPAGFFAAFHAYPYYPDFMVLDPGYATAASPFGPSNYFGYLRELARHHGDMPVVIAEYGVPASLGNAHIQPQGWHHGGHDEQAMARIDSRLTREIAAAGLAGGAVFAWIDEWFKRNWLVDQFEIPGERNRLWLNVMDPEQMYGMIAMEPEPRLPEGRIQSRAAAWSDRPILAGGASGGTVRAMADEAYLWVRVTLPPGHVGVGARVGFDLVGQAAEPFPAPDGSGATKACHGLRALTGPAGERAGPPAGVEFVLEVSRDSARLLAAPGFDPFGVVDWEEPPGSVETRNPAVTGAPPGFFRGWKALRVPGPAAEGPPESVTGAAPPETLRVVVNRLRIGRDTTAFPGMGYDRGFLPEGPPPDGFWEWAPDGNALELRIPWALLNVTDPSQRRVLSQPGSTRGGGGAPSPDSPFPTAISSGAAVTAEVCSHSGEVFRWPGASEGETTERLRWESWEEPRWRARRRPVYDSMQRTFEEISPGTSVADSVSGDSW